MGDIKFLNIEVAKTPQQLQKGLMFREKLSSNNGMIFSFPKDDVLSFWGMNTFIPLDIAFIDNSNEIDSIQRIKPHDLTSVKSKNKCCHAIEANEGWFDRNGISNGDFVEIFEDNLGNSPKVFFIKKQSSVKTAQLDSDDVDDLSEPTNEELDLISRDEFLNDSNPSESNYLVDNEGFVDDESDVTLEELDDAIDGAREYLDKPSDKKDETKGVPTDLAHIPRFGSVFQAINWGKENNQTMLIKYKTIKGNIISREIEPHDLFFAKTTRRQVMATFDRQVGAPRSFIVMNILEYSFNGVEFTPKFIVI